jgi:hypothetical protein
VAALIPWLEQNWLNFVQSAGIILGLLLTAFTIRRDTKARRATDLLTLAQHHREIWGELHRRPELQRILAECVDLIVAPITPAEEEFLNTVFVHYYTGWLLTKTGVFTMIPKRASVADIRSFFSLPIPKSMWQQTKQNRDPKFVSFVEKCLRN